MKKYIVRISIFMAVFFALTCSSYAFYGAAFRCISDDDTAYQARLNQCLIKQNIFITYEIYEDYHAWVNDNSQPPKPDFPNMQELAENELNDGNIPYAEHTGQMILIAYDLASNSFGLAKGKNISDELLTPENIKELKREYTSIKRETLREDVNACMTSPYKMLFTNHSFAYNLTAYELMHPFQEQTSAPEAANVLLWLWIGFGILAALGILLVVLLVFKPGKTTYQALALLLVLCCTCPLLSTKASAKILYGIGGAVSQEKGVEEVLTDEQIHTFGELRMHLSGQLGFNYFIYFVDDIEKDEPEVLNEKLVRNATYRMAVIVSQKQDKIVCRFSDELSPFFTVDDVSEIDGAFAQGGDLYARLKNGLDETVVRLYAGRNLLKDEIIDAALASRPSVPAPTEPAQTEVPQPAWHTPTEAVGLYLACAFLLVTDGILLGCFIKKRRKSVPKI